jgi:hypothetical protein
MIKMALIISLLLVEPFSETLAYLGTNSITPAIVHCYFYILVRVGASPHFARTGQYIISGPKKGTFTSLERPCVRRDRTLEIYM